jgi:hypothetical protein
VGDGGGDGVDRSVVNHSMEGLHRWMGCDYTRRFGGVEISACIIAGCCYYSSMSHELYIPQTR